MVRHALTSALVLLVGLYGCESDPPAAKVPTIPVDAGASDGSTGDLGRDDAGPSDGGADLGADSGETDVGALDGGESDVGADAGAVDTGPADLGPADLGPADLGPPDLGPPDLGPPDAGPPPDLDGDGILDVDEGNGLVDTDGDGTPDNADTDSDGDGIDDAVEAGDLDPSTPPIDTDGDGTPDFRDTDSDGDGIGDDVEGIVDTDGDGTSDYRDLDSDGDTIRDDQDGTGDPDGDGVANFRDPDSDGDGLLDALEAGDATLGTAPFDDDGDGTPNFLDLDSDGDTLTDAQEGGADTDGDTIADFLDIDSDGDTLFDADEAGDADLTTPAVDTDGDGTPDYLDLDSDADTISDLQEGFADPDGDGVPCYLDTDSDGDGVPDATEAGDADLATAPVDTDRDRLPDYRDTDSDADGLADGVELGCPTSTSRVLADSDGDGFVDPAELAYGSNPCLGTSIIDDFYFELPPGTTTSTAILELSNTQIDSADLAIDIDTTGSMSGEIANLRSGLSTTIIPGVRAAVADVSFAVSSFEDFPVAPFGDSASGDLPFRLGTRVTSNPVAAQVAVNGLRTRNGADYPEAGQVALHRIATGDAISWTGGNIAAFDPTVNRIAGVADGTIGGVGFRQDSLPIIVQVTDAVSHTSRDYPASISAPTTASVKSELSQIGARVITISQGGRPFDDLLCDGSLGVFFGDVAAAGNDADWFEIRGASAGATVQVAIQAQGFGSALDPMVAVANATGFIAGNDDVSSSSRDSGLTTVLTGSGPYYVAVTAYGDSSFNGSGQQSSGHYIATVVVNGGTNYRFPTPTQCRSDDAGSRTGATPIVAAAQASAPTDPAACRAQCDQLLGGLHPYFADFTFPYEIAEETGAVVPTCTWTAFGTRPATCASNECCTGQGGSGVAPNRDGMCPLAFEIAADGTGLDQAMVIGIQALVGFSTFDLTTRVRGDPNAAGGVDTTCFIQSVIPRSATPPNSCAPTPTAQDLLPPSGQNDTWVGAVPGTRLEFDVVAQNDDGTGQPCAGLAASPQLFRAWIDVLADGITVLDTREVIIIVPPRPPVGGGN